MSAAMDVHSIVCVCILDLSQQSKNRWHSVANESICLCFVFKIDMFFVDSAFVEVFRCFSRFLSRSFALLLFVSIRTIWTVDGCVHSAFGGVNESTNNYYFSSDVFIQSAIHRVSRRQCIACSCRFETKTILFCGSVDCVFRAWIFFLSIKVKCISRIPLRQSH